MRPLLLPFAAFAVALGTGALAAFAARTGVRGDPRGDEIATITLDRVEHTITLPPDHNARATYGVDPVLHLKRRNEPEVRRRLDALRPRLQDALQAVLSRYHYANLQRNESKDDLRADMRAAVNAILGQDLVLAVTVVKGASR
ncbi:MAG: flagellar basal body-associated FliL family protein [Planctomycetia bacterium]|nr:flagellar basal body-associated FliL family protein [Planctomycetia bacterium]